MEKSEYESKNLSPKGDTKTHLGISRATPSSVEGGSTRGKFSIRKILRRIKQLMPACMEDSRKDLLEEACIKGEAQRHACYKAGKEGPHKKGWENGQRNPPGEK